MKSFTEFSNEQENAQSTESENYSPSVFTDEETLAKDSAHLKESSAISFSKDSNGFSASVSRDKASLVFFSVPYDKGFTATVNGEKAEIIKANVGFMAVVVPEGLSEIRFDYTTPLLKEGIYISIGSAAVLLIYIIVCLLIKRKKQENEVYPEGEDLLDKWSKEEFKENYSHIGEFEKTESLLDSLDKNKDIFIPNTNKKYNGFNIDFSAFEDEKDIDNEEKE